MSLIRFCPKPNSLNFHVVPRASKPMWNEPRPRFFSKDKIFRPLVKCNNEVSHSKISVIGMGNVGQALMSNLLFMRITNELCFVDVIPDKIKADVLGFQQLSMHINHAKVVGSSSFDAITGSKICIVCAGVRPKPGESRITILAKNSELIKEILSSALKYVQDCIFILASNPVDIMTFMTAKISGFSPEKVLGSGTNLDSARLRVLMSQKYNVAIDACKGWVLGEHGLTSLVAWSTCTVGGVYITDINTKMGEKGDKENWEEIRNDVVHYGPGINKLKGYTNWGVACSICAICNSIINNTKEIHSVTVPAKGFHGICDNVYLSLPAVIGQNGILEILDLPLTESECEKLQKSAKFLFEHQETLKI